MKKYILKPRDLVDLIENYNPFAFKDEKQQVMLFRTYEEAYYELFKRIYAAGPIMVDAVVFCVDQWGMTLADAQRFVALWRHSTFKKDELYTFDWETGGTERDKDLEAFARGCHLISETKFNRDMFNYALERFLVTLKKERWDDCLKQTGKS